MGVNGIYGLSGSGMDIDSLVKVGMMGRQKEYDKMAQKYTKNEWTKAAYITLNSSITTFNMSTLSQYKMSSTMNAKTAESNSSAVKVSANGATPVMTHQVKVTSLSSNAYLIGGKIQRTNTDESAKTSINLKDLIFRSGWTIDTNNNTVDYTFVGENGYNYPKTSNLSDKAISFFIGDGTTETYTDPATEETVERDKTREISFTFDEVLNGKVTLNDLVSKINNAGLNVRATYDAVNERFSLYNTKGGEDNTIYLKAGSEAAGSDNNSGSIAAGFLTRLQLSKSVNGTWNENSALKFESSDSAKKVTGDNGKITVDGVTYTTTENKVTVNGITYNALAKTEDTPAVVTVSQDVDAIVGKVKGFIEDYNKLLSSLYEKYDEKPETGYAPLTQSQKDAMKEEQITKWEEKAQKGLLYHDQTIGKIINEMRSSITDSIEGLDGKYNSVFSLGISTTGIKGQLVLNEDKLRAALADDSDAVYNVFARLDSSQRDSSGNVINNPAGNGIAQRLGDVLTTASKNIKSRAGSSTAITEDSDLNNLLRQLQTKMSNFKKLMSSFEEKLYKKYDTMESALAKLGSQLSFITGGQ